MWWGERKDKEKKERGRGGGVGGGGGVDAEGGGEGALTHIHSPVAKIQKNDITKFSKLYWPNFTSGCWDIVTRGDDSLSSVDFCCGFVWSRCADTLRNI